MDLQSWQSQLRKGAAELVVLALVAEEELYGLEVLERATTASGVLSEGSIYPLLNRLEREGKLVSRWHFDEGSGNPRKYYRISDDGAHLLAQMSDIWASFSGTISTILKDGKDDHRTANRSRALSPKSRRWPAWRTA